MPIIFWIDVPDSEILNRLGSRLICPKCHKIYKADSVGAKQECEKCGGKLERRADDNEKTIMKRIAVYQKEEKSHRAYYKNLKTWFDINGDQPIDGVSAEIWSHLKPLLP
jgi:adenylate kinase